MKIEQLEHIIRAAAVIADDDERISIGSQSILGAHPNAPECLLVSAEADVYPKNHPERADLLDGTIGELSPFHETFGYYAQGVSPDTATLAEGWEDRPLPGRRQNRSQSAWCRRILRRPATRGSAAQIRPISYAHARYAAVGAHGEAG